MDAQAESRRPIPADEDLVVAIEQAQVNECLSFAEGIGRGSDSEAAMRDRAAHHEAKAQERRGVLARRRALARLPRGHHRDHVRPHIAAPVAQRPIGAAREHRASPSASKRGGDSGDSSDDPEPGPGSGRQLDSTDARQQLVERMAALDALTRGEA